MAYEYPAASDPFDEIMDRYRCREVDGLSSRCQLVVGHPVEHILERDGRLLVWPVGAEPQLRPPWATACPRDEA